MSKLYNKYLQLKCEDSSYYYLFKSGIFYIFLDEDAKKMSEILNLKLSNLNENILKCGFPINSFQKYSNLLNNQNYKIKIINNSNLNLNNNKEIKDFLFKLSNCNPDNFSIKEIYDFVGTISKEADFLINKFYS